jgi:predicted N-acetyltransferase YhbS
MAAMSIRSWLEKRRQRADADAIKRVEEEAVESGEERAHSHADRMGEGADNRISGRIGERPDDLNRLGDFDR